MKNVFKKCFVFALSFLMIVQCTKEFCSRAGVKTDLDSLNEMDSAICSDEPLYISSNVTYDTGTFVSHGSTVVLSYTLGTSLDAQYYQFYVSAENASLISESSFVVGTDNPDFQISFSAQNEGVGYIQINYQPIDNSYDEVYSETTTIHLYSTHDYDYISLNCIEDALYIKQLMHPDPEYDMNTQTKDDSSVVSGEIPAELPDEVKNGGNAETPSDVPSEMPTDIPSETPTDVPDETPTDVPSETPADTPSGIAVETPLEIPADTPGRGFDDGLNQSNGLIKENINSTTAADSNITVTGKIQWADAAGSYKPAKNIKYEIIDCDSTVKGTASKPKETVLTTSYTDSYGNVSTTIKNGASVRTGGYDICIRAYSVGTNIEVKSAASVIYTFDSAISNNIATSSISSIPVNIGTASATEQAFQVQQAAAMAAEYVKRMDGSYLSTLDVIYPFDSKGYSYYQSGKLYITTARYNVWDVIHHEYGHYVQSKFGTADSPGGTHSDADNLYDNSANAKGNKEKATKLAWGEGWATYFAITLQKYMISCGYTGSISLGEHVSLGDDKYRSSFSLETPPSPKGEANERAVMAVLYDLYDGKNDEQIYIGESTLWSKVKNNNMKTLGSLINNVTNSLSISDKLELGKILSTNLVGASITGPINGTYIVSRPSVFSWNAQGGSTGIPNNLFALTFYNGTKSTQILRITNITKTTYTPTESEWKTIIKGAANNKVYWTVEAYQNNSPSTGPYFSNYAYFDVSKVFIAAPRLLSVKTQDYQSISLNWSGVSGANGYEVYRSTNSTSGFVLAGTVTGGKVSFTDSGLATGTRFYYKLKAYKTVSSSKTYSEDSNILAGAAVLSAAKLSKVVSRKFDAIALMWEKVPGAYGYEIYRSESSSGAYSKIQDITNGTVLQYVNTGLVTNKTYYYKVRAYCRVNSNKVYAAYSNVLYTKPVLTSPVITTLETPAKKSIKITWNTAAGASGYEIYRSTSQNGTYSLVTTISNGTTTTYKNTGLSSSTTYYYKMRAYRTINGTKTYSMYSNILSKKTT